MWHILNVLNQKISTAIIFMVKRYKKEIARDNFMGKVISPVYPRFHDILIFKKKFF